MKGECKRSKSINEFKDKIASWPLDVVSIYCTRFYLVEEIKHTKSNL